MKYEIISTSFSSFFFMNCTWFPLFGFTANVCAKPFEWIKCASLCMLYTRSDTCSNRMPLWLLQLIDDGFSTQAKWRVQCSKVNGRHSRGWQTTEPIHFLYLNLFFLKKEHFRAWRECWFDKVNKFSTKITKLFSIYTFSIQEITQITPISIQENERIEKVCWKNVWILKFKISTLHSKR